MSVSAFSQLPPIEPGVSQQLARWRAAHYSDVHYKLNLTLEKMSPVLKGTMEIRVTVRRGGGETRGRGEAQAVPPASAGGTAPEVRRGDGETRGRGEEQSVPPASAGGAAPGAESASIILDWRKLKGYEERSTISNVSLNGRVLSPSFTRPGAEGSSSRPPEGGTQNTFEESSEHLIFREGVIAGENVIKLDFTSPILPSGSAITRYIDKEDGSEYIYSLFVPSDASTAFPVFDQPDLKARFTLRMNGPEEWTAISNGSAHSAVVIDDSNNKFLLTGREITDFDQTQPISTYVFAFAAGPWQRVSDPSGGTQRQQSVPPAVAGGSQTATSNPPATAGGTDSRGRLGASAPADDVTSIYVRKSQLSKFQPHAAEVFRLNREGVKFLEEYFNYKFPFPKYDLVLIPEFPFGGMEHAGATFLRESAVIFPSEPTKNDHISRANLIFHEAAHQWFGDTVTMRWFDDLWLKEGFAEFMAYKTLERVMPEYNAWKAFYERNKQSAYLTDSTKGTTPIYQEIKNLSAAKSAYGNIVYRKAPSFLKQAEFYIGADKFQTAVRAFLKKHEFANAGWQDLVKEFQTAGWQRDELLMRNGTVEDIRKYEEVSKNTIAHNLGVWVNARGVPLIRMGMGFGGLGPGVGFFQIDNIENKKYSDLWTHYFNVLFRDRDGRQFVKEQFLGFEGEVVEFSQLPLKNRPVLIFPNYQDYGYGIFLLDDKSRDYILKNIQNEKDEFLRSMMWGALWDSVRESELDPKEYVELVIKVLSGTPTEDETTVASLLNRVSTAITYYIPDKQRDEIAPRLEAILIEKMRSAPTLGQRITYYRALLNVGSTENARSVLKELSRQQSVPPAVAGGSETATKNPPATAGGTAPHSSGSSIPLKTKDRFDIVTKLASLADPDAERLLADLEKTETSDDAKRYAYAARAAFPTKETKEKYWSDFRTNKEISESWIEAAFGPFNSVRHADLTLPYLERALKELPNHKRNRKIFFVNGWLAAFIGGQKSEQALAIVNKFLADNPNLDRDLRLKILENVDIIERAVKIRGKYGS